MKKTTYIGKCGTCRNALPILGTRACFCEVREYTKHMAPGHPFPVYHLSRGGCWRYDPIGCKDGSIERDVLCFIGRFSHGSNGVRQEVVEAFTGGCCVWFARILEERFISLNPEIVADYAKNHFGTRINGRVYDITGDVTEGHNWELWADCAEPVKLLRITQDCIYF